MSIINFSRYVERHRVSFDITFGVCQHHHNVGSRHLPLVHVRMTSKLKGRFENNRELLRKGIGRSPFPFSRNFEIFRETTLKTLV